MIDFVAYHLGLKYLLRVSATDVSIFLNIAVIISLRLDARALLYGYWMVFFLIFIYTLKEQSVRKLVEALKDAVFCGVWESGSALFAYVP